MAKTSRHTHTAVARLAGFLVIVVSLAELWGCRLYCCHDSRQQEREPVWTSVH